MAGSDAIEEVERELNDATRRAWTLVHSTDGRLFTVRPNPSSWSAAECISHLSISTEMFLPILRSAIEDGRKRGLKAKGKPRMDLLGRVLRWFLEPPTRSRVRTTAPFVPRAVRAKAEAFGEFANLQQKLGEILQSAKDVDLGKIKIVSPFDKRVKYNLYSAFRIVVAHQRRHLWQAEQAVAALRH
ncbi:MAG TPA: DinB family protein [Thermoanaerobaculia bacterium]|nr:DinB family protein [Thermoanaerobaculia bacterium]